MDWPSCSPDLNPIEKLWAISKSNVEEFMTEEWNSILESVLNNLLNSMRCRCELVIENNSEQINF